MSLSILPIELVVNILKSRTNIYEFRVCLQINREIKGLLYTHARERRLFGKFFTKSLKRTFELWKHNRRIKQRVNSWYTHRRRGERAVMIS